MKTKKDFTIIQKLSPNGVYLIREHQGLKVLREFVNNDLSKMLSILDFYKEDFPYRPIVQKVGENFFIEEYLEGKNLATFQDHNLQHMVHNLSLMKNLTQGNTELKSYMQSEFSNFYKQFGPKYLQEKERMLYRYNILAATFPDNMIVSLQRIHGDLQVGNRMEKQNALFFIDWERTRQGNNAQDIQKFLYKLLGYTPLETDKFINLLLQQGVIDDYEAFHCLEVFFYLLSCALDLLKQRISLEDFEKKIIFKYNTYLQGKLF